ncbi:MAG: ATP-binding protein, partial [Acidobacteriota bacterium]
RELEEIETTAREALREVRRAVAGYRHAQIGTELVKARVALDSAGVDIDVRTSPYDLSPESETILAMALREAATNIVRHARADRCRIRSRVEGDEYWLEVEDDGVGIQGPPDSGLRGMRERLEGAGGSLDISPARFASQGTLLRARLPLQRVEPTSPEASRELA